jgi:3-oxoacyl-[acyl-carrier-protein] synthase-3
MRVCIAGAAYYLPERRQSSKETEALIRKSSDGFAPPNDLIELITGVHCRRVADECDQTSDLAARAAERVFEQTGVSPREIDVLIFASAGQDVVEPATANIVQEKIGTCCPVFDVKNACNSFLNGVQVAESLILNGVYQTALVAVGETPSRVIKWAVSSNEDFKQSFSGYTMGDAGAAVILRGRYSERGIFHSAFQTESRYWDVGAIFGGGSMHPRGDEWTYLQCDGKALRDAFEDVGPSIVQRALRETRTTFSDYRCILTHQVTMPFLKEFVRVTGIPYEKLIITLPELGNIAAATIPVQFALAWERGQLQPGDRVMWIGLAAGLSVGVLLMQV